MASLGERSNGQRKTCPSRRARTEKSGSGNSHRCRRNGRHRDPALGGLIFNGGLGNARLSAIRGFTVKRRPAKFRKSFGGLERPRNRENKTAKPYPIFGGLISCGSLHLLANLRLSAICRQGHHQLRRHLLTHPFLAEMTVWLVGIGRKTAKNRCYVHAREPG